jgi:dCTP deaminase
MILSDKTLKRRGRYLVDPFDYATVQPASIDLHLDHIFLVPEEFESKVPIDVTNLDMKYDTVDAFVFDSNSLIVHPHQFVLGSTFEKIIVPNDLVGSIEGKSSLARLGLFVHITAGFCDPGFQGKVTLEILNVNNRPIRLNPGMKICQIAFAKLDQICANPYGSPGLGSHYQNQTEVTGSRYGL